MLRQFYKVVKDETLLKLSKIILEEYPKHYTCKFDFAIAADVDEKTIRRILKGEQNLSIKVLIKICNALRIKPSDLFAKINL